LIDGLGELRSLVEDRMRGTCKIERVVGTTVDDDGKEVNVREQVYPDPEWPAEHPHADGKCYLRYPGLAFESTSDSVGVTVTQSRIVARIPFGPVIAVDDVITVLSDPDTPHLAGATLRVASIDDQSQATAQRLLCEDNQKGVRINEP